MNFGTLSINPEALLGKLEDHLKRNLGLSSDTCFLSIATDEDHLGAPPADRFVTIFPEAFPPWQSVVAGGGRTNTGYDGTTRITIFGRLQVDQEFRSSELLRNASLGLVQIATKAAQALQFWTAPDDTGLRSYLREYARLTRGPTFRSKHVRKETWALCSMSLETKFTATFGGESV